MPDAAILTRTSPGPGGSNSISSTLHGVFVSRSTAARVFTRFPLLVVYRRAKAARPRQEYSSPPFSVLKRSQHPLSAGSHFSYQWHAGASVGDTCRCQRSEQSTGNGPTAPHDTARHRGARVADNYELRTSRSEDLTFVACTVWLIIGLGLDGWAHRTRPELESFFTPWHAVFYAGFTAAASWLTFLVYRRAPSASSLTGAIPPGYELSVVGLGVFAVGGVGDAIWHTIFGVESSIDALLSPTHLLMLAGGTMAASAPVRAAWRDPSEPTSPTFGRFVAPMVSTAVVASAFAFFFLYGNGFNNWPMQYEYIPFESEVLAAYGVLATQVSTVIMIGSVLLLLRRWNPPFGTFSVVFGVIGPFMAGLDGFTFWWQIIAPFVGGVTADVVLRVTAGRSRRTRAAAVGLVTPLLMWAVASLALHTAWGILWPPELWVGQIVMAMLVGFVLSLLVFPPPVPASDRPRAD